MLHFRQVFVPLASLTATWLTVVLTIVFIDILERFVGLSTLWRTGSMEAIGGIVVVATVLSFALQALARRVGRAFASPIGEHFWQMSLVYVQLVWNGVGLLSEPSFGGLEQAARMAVIAASIILIGVNAVYLSITKRQPV